LCKERGNPCDESGTYKANSSSTYSYLASNFNISYVDGSGASGDYVTDTFVIGGTTVTSLQFGIGYTSTSPQGILGIGYEINEVQVGRAGGKPYNNLPAALVAQGKIATNAYSLWLNDLEANTGSILFGGVDTEQFHGMLSTLPIQKVSGFFAEFLITLTSLSLGSTAIVSNQAIAVLLDSGSSLTYLPNTITAAIYEQVDAQYDSTEGAAYVPCSLADNTTTLDFIFTSTTISVQMNELVLDIDSPSGHQLTFSDGTAACLFGIAPAGSATAVLGDTFIRSAYIVYDLSNNQISIAQTNFNATKSNVLEITASTSGVPSATAVQNAATATPGSSGGTVTSGSSTASSAPSTAAAVSNSAPLGALAAVSIGILLAAM
jgi:Eukaryotic aspartyl protease